MQPLGPYSLCVLCDSFPIYMMGKQLLWMLILQSRHLQLFKNCYRSLMLCSGSQRNYPLVVPVTTKFRWCQVQCQSMSGHIDMHPTRKQRLRSKSVR